MYFHEPEFIFVFLPVTLLVFLFLETVARRDIQLSWLVMLSLIFYGWWNPEYVALLALSIFVNYAIGLVLARLRGAPRRHLMIGAVGLNLALLGYFKYANFFLTNVNALGMHLPMAEIALPIGISFFTFQQVCYVVDIYNGKAPATNFIHYALFICFFPHMIAGPILHHAEILPQFTHRRQPAERQRDLRVGMIIFLIGMIKKIVLADSAGPYASLVFDSAANGAAVTFGDAWLGALAYTLQIYYDFSGYSDMAIGLARFFGVTLPVNFNSPYKAESIIDFWRRWHMTLSRLLRDYLYIPLGGNRRGRARSYANLLTTMLIGGLWHGASWTFVAWGGLHGLYLVVNRVWHTLGEDRWPRFRESRCYRGAMWMVTFIAVVVAWVFFRAWDFASAARILKAIADIGNIKAPSLGWPTNPWAELLGAWGLPLPGICWFGLLFAIAFWLPNTQELLAEFRPALGVPGEARGALSLLIGKFLRPIVSASPEQPGPAMNRVVAAAMLLGVFGTYISLQLANPAGVTSFIYAFF